MIFRSPGWPSNDDSDKVLHNLNNVANNCLQIQTSCQQIHHQNEAGFSKLVSITQEVQQRQFDLLDKFSHHVRVTKIDEKYKEQYLETIKQLVHEQVIFNVILYLFWIINLFPGQNPDLY